MNPNNSRSLLYVVPVLVLFGCGNSDEQVGTTFIKSVDVAAADGATINVSANESAALAGTQLVIFPNSLAQDTTITLSFDPGSIVVFPNESAGPVALFEPSGTVFAGSALLTLPFSLTGSQAVAGLYVEVLEATGDRSSLFPEVDSVDGSTGFSTVAISGFTRYGHGIRRCGSHDDSDSDSDGDSDSDSDSDSDGDSDGDRCVPPPAQEICDDQIDNDGDRDVDCADADCAAEPVCCVRCAVEICDDRLDNDGDLAIDCADSDCFGSPWCPTL